MNRKIRIRDTYRQPQNRKPVAAALQYDPERDAAPKVVASGQGKIAEQILTLAQQNGIPIYEDPALTLALSEVNLGEEIPPELYIVVAEVLAFLYRASGKASDNMHPIHLNLAK